MNKEENKEKNICPKCSAERRIIKAYYEQWYCDNCDKDGFVVLD